MRRLRADATAAILAAGLAFLPLRAAAGPAVASPGGTWLRYPLPGAEVKSLAAEPRAPGLFYAGTALGGVYRSTDGGRSWTAPPGGAPFPGYSVTSLVPDPQRVVGKIRRKQNMLIDHDLPLPLIDRVVLDHHPAVIALLRLAL